MEGGGTGERKGRVGDKRKLRVLSSEGVKELKEGKRPSRGTRSYGNCGSGVKSS